MKGATGSLLVVLGLGILYLAVTGKLDRLGAAWATLVGKAQTLPGLGPSTPKAPPKPAAFEWPVLSLS